MEPIFEQQDTELPSQLLTRRFNYHLQMLENFELGTEKSEHHDKMVRIYGLAIDILKREEEKAVCKRSKLFRRL